jgi:ATP-dependent helicase/DNAse subunit B
MAMKELLYTSLGSNIRSYLIQEALTCAQKGQQVLYLVPSREVIFSVRDAIMNGNGSMDVIVGGMEDLEEWVLGSKWHDRRIIDSDTGLFIMQRLLSRDVGFFNYSAKTTGFSREMLDLVRELKRTGLKLDKPTFIPGDVEHAESASRWHATVRLGCMYQQELDRLQLSDVDDISQKAAIDAETPDLFSTIGLIIIDGFVNLDEVHMAMLARITSSHPQLPIMVSIPFKTHAGDAFIQNEIIQRLEAMGFVSTEVPDAAYNHVSEGAKLCQDWFSECRPVGSQPANETDLQVCIYSSPCVEDEVRQTLKQVKKLMMESDQSPSDFLLIVRSQNGYVDYLPAVAEELGIPLSFSSSHPLHQSALIKDVLLTLTQIAAGATPSVEAPFWFCHHQHPDADFEHQWQVLQGKWAGDKTLGEYAMDMMAWLDTSFWDEALAEAHQSGVYTQTQWQREVQSMQSLYRILDGFRNIQELLEPNPMNTETFLNMLNAQVQEKTTSVRRQTGGVRVVDPDLVRGLHANHVFIMGLNEGEFPHQSPGTGILRTTDRLWLQGKNIHLKTPEWEFQREKIRFLWCVAAATRSLTLSCRSAGEDGTYTQPSPFLTDARQYLGFKTMSERTLRDRYRMKPEDWFSMSEAFRQLVMDQQWDAALNLLQEADDSISNGLKEALPWFLEARHMIADRYATASVGLFDGWLAGADFPQQDLAYRYSASQLNSYATCPFKYFSDKVVNLKVDEEEEEWTHLVIGNLYHTVLKEYYAQAAAAVELDAVLLAAQVRIAMDEMKKDQYSSVYIEAKRLEVQATLETFISADLADRNQYESVTGKQLVPTFFEADLKIDGPFDGISFNARIDRIDLEMDQGQPTGRFVVYDYKRKNAKTLQDILKGADYQLLLYAILTPSWVAMKLERQSAVCLGAFFYTIVEPSRVGFFRGHAKKQLGTNKKDIQDAMWEPFLDLMRNRISRLVMQIRQGDFALSTHCPAGNPFSGMSCPYSLICRFDRERLQRKEVRS